MKETTSVSKLYKVSRNRCDCHPETCCCRPWLVLDPSGYEVAGFHSEYDALKLVNILNVAQTTQTDTRNDKPLAEISPECQSYRIERNRCDCHPETCSCGSWVMIDPAENKITTFRTRVEGENFIQQLNHALAVAEAGA